MSDLDAVVLYLLFGALTIVSGIVVILAPNAYVRGLAFCSTLFFGYYTYRLLTMIGKDK